nr:protein bric-a-brac 2-like isoform X3 [Cherax quadricarinatus]
MDGGLLSLRWNDHRQTFFKMLSGVRKREAYCDVTLACDGRFYPVHKLVLSTCSDFFDEMFEKTACKHPVIVVANVAYKDLEALLNYMYLGEVNVLQNDLTGLMKAAEALRIKGLAEPVNAPSTKDIRESKRSSLWEDDLPDGKRKRSEEVPPTATTDNDRTGRREMQKSRITSNDSETSRHKAQVPSSGSNSSNSTDQPGATSSAEMLSHSANQDMGASSQSDADNEPVDKALRPEVKMEDVLVKEEPAGWFPETEEGLDSLQFSEADTGLAYAPQQTTFRSGCLPWELAAAAATQAHVLDSQLPHGLPGPSRMQGILQLKSGATTDHLMIGTSQRRDNKLYVAGFAYTKNRSRGVRAYWRCSDRTCPGRLVLLGNDVVKAGKHSHPPEPDGKTTADLNMDNYLQPEELQQGTCYQILSNEDCSRAREKARRKRHYERQKLKHNTDKDYREKMRRKWRERKARQRSKGDKSREHHSKDTGIRESLYYASPKVELYQV